MLETLFDLIRTYPAVSALVIFVAAIFIWHEWELRIRPLLIPSDEINAIVDDLIAQHGPRAEKFAYIEEKRAWRYADITKQGKWRRVRCELWRRYNAGEWE